MANLTLLQGGLGTDLGDGYEFADGAVTDTRLMGVLGLRIHWKKEVEGRGTQNIYQFYYYDIEEIGLDTLTVYVLDTEDEVESATKSCFGGLGAVMWPITEPEARWMVHRFVDETKRKKQLLPENIDQVRFNGLFHVVSDQHDRQPLGKQVLDRLHDFPSAARIKHRGRFIHDHTFRFHRQYSGDR